MNKTKYFLSAIAFLVSTEAFCAKAEKESAKSENPFFGVWETQRVPEEGEDRIARIKIDACKDNPKNICGHVVWTEVQIDPDTGKPPLDKFNSDESLRSRPVLCIQTLKDFEPGEKPNTYENGKLYSSRKGKTYNGSMEMKDNDHLLLTGGVLFGLISRTTTWTRVKDHVKDPCGK